MNKFQLALDDIKSRQYQDDWDNLCDVFDEDDEAIATLQELVDKVPYYEELEDKATPIKVTSMMLWVNIYEHNCPLCEEKVDKTDYYCRSCGQALDWSEDGGE